MAKRIFVVDDEPWIADSLVAILRQSGYEASAFYNAQSALEEAATCFPDLLISDVMMPGMDGVEMAVHFREHNPKCKILLFSGMASTLNVLDMVGRLGYDFELVAKPIHPADLLAKIVSISDESES